MNFSLIVIGRLNSLIATKKKKQSRRKGNRVSCRKLPYIVTVGGFHLSNFKISIHYKPFVFLSGRDHMLVSKLYWQMT